MKRFTWLSGFALCMACILTATSAHANICSVQKNVNFNILPRVSPNIVDKDFGNLIPVAIFGSSGLDVTDIVTRTLRLAVHILWESSRVETSSRNMPLCEIRDVGSHDTSYPDNFGPRDGYADLLCQFTNELAMFRNGMQEVALTGFVARGDSGYDSPILGLDSVGGPGSVDDVVRCCTVCDEEGGGCYGCSGGDIYDCDFELRQCAGSVSCYDCTGCKKPEIC